MQSKPVSDAAEVAMVLRAETGFGPILDAALMAGRVVIDDRTTSITMSPPNRLVAPLTRHHQRGAGAGRAPGGGAGREGHARGNERLLADLVLPAGGGWAGRAAGQGPRRQA